MSDRTAEIWSTRLQRELLALSESQSPSEGKESTAKNEVSMLPPFVTMSDHIMDIEKGICKVNFRVEVETPKVKEPTIEPPTETPDSAAETTDTTTDSTAETTDSTAETTDAPTENIDPPAEKNDPPTETPPTTTNNHIMITLNASMETDKNGAPYATPNTYPFQKPLATLTSGAALLPPNSTLTDNSPISIDCDWTPSLHLADAALNVALKLRESIKKGDPFPSEAPTPTVVNQPATFADVRMGDIVDLNAEPFNLCAGMYSCKAIRRPEFVERAIKDLESRQAQVRKGMEEAFLEDDEETPMGIGNYMRLQAGGIRKVAGAGIVGAGSIFKSIVNSTKSVLEESFLMVTDEHIIELRSSKFSIGTACVIFVNPISLLAKLKFRRQESISLFFKQAPDDPLIFMCPDSADAVTQIQTVLKRHGVKGKHTNAATQRAIQAALNIVVDIQAKERSLKDDPTVENVDEIMSLYRQAAEKFESAGDARHEEVMSHMHKFLAKPLTLSILDGSYKANSSSSSVPQGEVLDATSDQLDDHGDDDEPKDRTPVKSKQPRRQRSTDDAIQKTDDILEEAKRDFDNYGIGDDDDDDLDNFLTKNKDSAGEKDDQSGDHDAVAELDAMLSAADKELTDLMKS